MLGEALGDIYGELLEMVSHDGYLSRSRLGCRRVLVYILSATGYAPWSAYHTVYSILILLNVSQHLALHYNVQPPVNLYLRSVDSEVILVIIFW